jgi:hypothetical protein
MHVCVCVCEREKCLCNCVYVCMRVKNVYVCSRVPFVPLPVSVFILLHVHGPWPRVSLSGALCVTLCVPTHTASVCVRVRVCVRVCVFVYVSEIQRDLCCGPTGPVSCIQAGRVCFYPLSLCLSLCDCGCNGSHVQLTEGLAHPGTAYTRTILAMMERGRCWLSCCPVCRG